MSKIVQAKSGKVCRITVMEPPREGKLIIPEARLEGNDDYLMLVASGFTPGGNFVETGCPIPVPSVDQPLHVHLARMATLFLEAATITRDKSAVIDAEGSTEIPDDAGELGPVPDALVEDVLAVETSSDYSETIPQPGIHLVTGDVDPGKVARKERSRLENRHPDIAADLGMLPKDGEE